MLRATERLLIEELGQARAEEGGGCAGVDRLQKKLDEISTGLLVISLHGLRQAHNDRSQSHSQSSCGHHV